MGYVITSTTNTIHIDYGMNGGDFKEGVFRKENISFQRTPTCIEVTVQGFNEWFISFDGNSTTAGQMSMTVDEVNGVAPTSTMDLFGLLKLALN